MNYRKWVPVAAINTIVIFGFLLRVYNLSWQCLKVDELVTQKGKGGQADGMDKAMNIINKTSKILLG